MTIGKKIQASDYNNFRKIVNAIFGNGGTNPFTNLADPKWGYGQPLQSSDVDLDKKIGKSDWNKLIYDIANAWQQQNGTSITEPLTLVVSRGLVEGNKIKSDTITIKNILAGSICETEIEHALNVGDIFIPSITSSGMTTGTTYYIKTIPTSTRFTLSESLNGATKILAAQNNVNILGNSSAQPYNYLNSVITNLSTVENRFKVATLSDPPPVGEKGGPVRFRAAASIICDVYFGNANEARWFFNSGGQLFITAAFSQNLSNDQNDYWRDFLNLASATDPPKLTGTTPINYYNLTEATKTLYLKENSSIVTYNKKFKWRVDVSTPGVTNNSNGTASQIRFSIIFEDTYVDPDPPGFRFAPDDEVFGSFTVTIRQKKSSFINLPAGSGSFLINGPTRAVFTQFVGDLPLN